MIISAPLTKTTDSVSSKIDWWHATRSEEAFSRLILGAPNVWSVINQWALYSTTRLPSIEVHMRLIQSLWHFTMRHSFMGVANGLVIQLPNGKQVPASPQWVANGPIEHLLAWECQGPIHNRYINLQMSLMHDSAHHLMRTNNSPQESITMRGRYNACFFFFRDIFNRTYRWALAELRDFPGVTLVGFANNKPHDLFFPQGFSPSTCLLDAGPDLDYAALSDFMKKKLNVSLWSLLRPSTPILLDAYEDNLAVTWLGFFIHPLFHKLLPAQRTWEHNLYIVKPTDFVTATGVPTDDFSHFVASTAPNQPPVFWPTSTNIILPMSMRVYANHRLALRTKTRRLRSEWLQVRAITKIMRGVRMDEFEKLTINKIDLIRDEHPALKVPIIFIITTHTH